VFGSPASFVEPPCSAATPGVAVVYARAPQERCQRRDGRFQLVHEDPVAVVFVARVSEGAPRFAERRRARNNKR